MCITINDVIKEIFANGIAESPAAQQYLERALTQPAGRPLSVAAVMDSLLSDSAWTPEAQERIRSALYQYEGQVISSERSQVTERLRQAILSDTNRWGLSDAHKQQIINDNKIMKEMAGEYSEKEGFNSLLDYVVDDYIFFWKQDHPEKSSLEELMSLAKEHQKSVFLTPYQVQNEPER